MTVAAQRCEACDVLRYDVRRIAILVEGALRLERDLCRACLSEAIEALMEARAIARGLR